MFTFYVYIFSVTLLLALHRTCWWQHTSVDDNSGIIPASSIFGVHIIVES